MAKDKSETVAEPLCIKTCPCAARGHTLPCGQGSGETAHAIRVLATTLGQGNSGTGAAKRRPVDQIREIPEKTLLDT
jgi:hypothetical protein